MYAQADLAVYIVCVIIGVVGYLTCHKPFETRRFRPTDAVMWVAMTVFVAFIFTGGFR